MTDVFTETLPNGIRVVGEYMPSYASVAVNVYIRAGSVYETQSERGISHLIEHMLFKGTQTRSAKQLAVEIDAVGGSINAYTAKECTCVYVKVLSEFLPLAADVISDMLYRSKFDKDDLEREKKVVCEEILMSDDTPDDVAFENLSRVYYDGAPLSYPILGTDKSVNALTREDIIAYMRRMYIPKNIVISCAGNFKKDELMAILTDKFCVSSDYSEAETEYPCSLPISTRAFDSVIREVSQAHICLALPAPSIKDPLKNAAVLFSNILGGTSSSRYFQVIREERGLAYSVFSYASSYIDSGVFEIYAGTSEENALAVTRLMLDELNDIRKNGVTKDEFIRCKEQIKGSLALSFESTSAHASTLGKALLLHGRFYTADEYIEQVEAITNDDVSNAISFITDFGRLCGVVVGSKRNKPEVARVRELVMGYEA